MNNDDFIAGIFLALINLYYHDSHVQACEITEQLGGLKILRSWCKKHGSELENDVCTWIKTAKK